jgi:hypothetical protein
MIPAGRARYAAEQVGTKMVSICGDLRDFDDLDDFEDLSTSVAGISPALVQSAERMSVFQAQERPSG